MIFERIKSAGIAHNSYMIGSGSESAVIDPRCDCQTYVDSAQQKDMLDRGEKLLILDTQSQEEWESGHIKGALHIYVGHLEQRLAEVPRDKPVAVYCRTGHRAGLGASILLRAGYPVVYNFPGNIKAWVAAGFPVTTDWYLA